jgi:ribosomal protein S1
MPNTLAGINKLYDPTSIIGETFQVMIESFSEYEGTYIVSRRKYLQSLIQKSKFIRI